MESTPRTTLLVCLVCWALTGLGARGGGAEFEISTAPVGSTARPAVAVDAAGDLVVVWYGQGSTPGALAILARHLQPDGTPLTAVELLATPTAAIDEPVVAAVAGGGFVVAWPAYVLHPYSIGVFAQLFDQNGSSRGPETLVGTQPSYSPSSVAVAALTGGGFVVVFVGDDGSEGGILARPYDWQGEPTADPQSVNLTTGGHQLLPAVASLPGRGALVAWVSDDTGAEPFKVCARLLDATGAPSREEVVVSEPVGGSCVAPAVAADSSGRTVVTWHREPAWPSTEMAGIWARLLEPDGTVIGGEILVDATESGAPAVAFLDGGPFLVAWVGESPRLLAARRFSADGTPFGHAFRVDPSADAYHLAPRVVVDQEGSFVVVYTRPNEVAFSVCGTRLPPEPTGGTLQVLDPLLRVVEDDTVAQVRVIRSGGSEGEVSVNFATRGVTARAGVDFVPVVGTLVFPDGDDAPRPAAVQILANDVADGDRVLTVELAEPWGGAELAEPMVGSIVILDDDFAPPAPGPPALGPAVPAGAPGVTRTAPGVASLGADRFLVVWREGGTEEQVVVRPFSASGEALGPPSQVAEQVDPGSAAAVAADGVTGFVAWVADNAVYGRRVDPRGIPVAPAVEVAVGYCPYQSCCTQVESVAVACLGDGGYLVAWTQSISEPLHGIYWLEVGARQVAADDTLEGTPIGLVIGQYFNFAGYALGSSRSGEVVLAAAWWDAGVTAYRWGGSASAPEPIEVTTSPSWSAPAVAVAEAGGFVVAWTDLDVSGYPEWSDVYARRFAGDGTPSGGSFRLNHSSPFSQSRPALAVDQAGNLSAVWESERQDGDGAGVFGQRFTAYGFLAGGEYRINERAAGDQARAATASDPDGRSLVAWQDSDGAGGSDVLVRGFDANAGNPPPRRVSGRLRP